MVYANNNTRLKYYLIMTNVEADILLITDFPLYSYVYPDFFESVTIFIYTKSVLSLLLENIEIGAFFAIYTVQWQLNDIQYM